MEEGGAALENESVHKVYEAIAPHFSNTRYKPWPLVEKFLQEQPLGSLVADVGCGNGKYMSVNAGSCYIGCDRSTELANICAQRKFECAVCDNLHLPYRTECFDAVISIAVVHHMSTRERRIQAIKELFRVLKRGGTMLVTVWAFEQKNKTYTEQDVMIPWHLQEKYHNKDNQGKGKRKQRQKAQRQNAKRNTDTEEKKQEEQDADNIDLKKEPPLATNTTDQQATNQGTGEEERKREKFVVYNRYYHLFKEGELESIAREVENLNVVECAYDHDNWYLFAKKD